MAKEKIVLDTKQKKVLDYYGIKNYNNIMWINDVNDYVHSFLKKYVFDCVKSNEGRKKTPQDYVFRGLSHPNQKYSKITNVLYKRSFTSPLLEDKSFGKALNKELLYIRKFEQNTPQLASEYHNVLDLVATAQHNSLRTRLIDWTRSPLIATLFSLHDTPAEKGKDSKWKGYYMILVVNNKDHIVAQGLPLSEGFSQNQIENYMIYGEMLRYLTEVYETADDTKREIFFKELLAMTNTKYMLSDEGVAIKDFDKDKTIKKLSGKLKSGNMFFLETNFSNSRITSQRGLFQISVNPTKAYIDNCYKHIDLVLIAQEARDSILEYCKRLGMNNYGLMPDMQSIALEINRMADEEALKEREKNRAKKTQNQKGKK